MCNDPKCVSWLPCYLVAWGLGVCLWAGWDDKNVLIYTWTVEDKFMIHQYFHPTQGLSATQHYFRCLRCSARCKVQDPNWSTLKDFCLQCLISACWCQCCPREKLALAWNWRQEEGLVFKVVCKSLETYPREKREKKGSHGVFHHIHTDKYRVPACILAFPAMHACLFAALCAYMSPRPSSSSAGCVLVWHEVADTKKAAYSSWSLFGPGWAGWRAPGGLPGCHQQGFISPWGLMRFHQVPRAACNRAYTQTRKCMHACVVCTHDHRKCKQRQASLQRRAE